MRCAGVTSDTGGPMTQFLSMLADQVGVLLWLVDSSALSTAVACAGLMNITLTDSLSVATL